jgi:hypothetical protein
MYGYLGPVVEVRAYNKKRTDFIPIGKAQNQASLNYLIGKVKKTDEYRYLAYYREGKEVDYGEAMHILRPIGPVP